ncbi:hypothetical protein DFH06DRAFT_221198 [Mycena polygramma]|nr:hypothetical protein DFH06DRAFT_221198 [Mycena polygramma]
MTTLRCMSLVFWALSAVHGVASVPHLAELGSRTVNRRALSPRQSDVPIVPAKCAVTCDPVTDILQSEPTCTPAVCCTTLFQSGYFNCFECLGPSGNVTKADYAQPQVFLDDLTLECAAAGIKLPELTFPGQNPNRTLSLSGLSTSGFSTLSQSTVSSLPSSLSTPPPISQKTVTAAPSDSSSAPSRAGPSTVTSLPTSTPPNAAMRSTGGVEKALGLLSFLVVAWTMV